MVCSVNRAVADILLEDLRLLDKQGKVGLRGEGLVDVIRRICLRVAIAEVVEDVGFDTTSRSVPIRSFSSPARQARSNILIDEDQVHHVRQAPVAGEPTQPLEEARVRITRDGRVRRVVAVTAKVVGRDVALREAGRGLPACVAAAGGRLLAVLDAGHACHKGVDAAVAGGEGHRGCGWAG